jgi:N-acetylglucosamine kinase-like BadF-type ATPase
VSETNRDVTAIGEAPAAIGGAPVTILAADVGNSKTDVVLVGADGSLLAARRGPTASHQRIGLGGGTRRLVELAASVGSPPGAAALAVICAAGADTPAQVRRLRGRYERAGLGRRLVVRNDTDAILRAASPVGWGISLVCGSGVNCLGIAPDGRSYRLPALGSISGDWGGGQAVGMAGLGAAIRGRDGRGPRTVLEQTLPAVLGVHRPVDVALGIEAGRIDEARIRDLAPAVFAAARGGDAEARAIVDRLADELATMATAAIRRLRLVRTSTPVVLGGAVFSADDPAFLERFRDRLAAAAPRTTVVRLAAPPVLGAALLGLDEVGAQGDAADRLRAAITEARFQPAPSIPAQR